jgi:predicted O-linked N-acetylglucosamine transferase (SPINDLY family)
MSRFQDSLHQAMQLHQSGRILEAIALYRKLLRKQPASAQLLFLLGAANAQIGQLELAIEQFKRSLVFDNSNPFAHYNLGRAFQDTESPEEALACYDKALALNPDNAEACNNKGNVLRELKRLDEALESIDRALTLRPGHADTYNNRGNVLHDLKRLDEALANYDQALALNPGHAEAYNNRGRVLHSLKRLDEALASYDRTLTLNPGHAEAYNNRGRVLHDLKRLDEALASYDQALALVPGFAEAWSNRSSELIALRQFEAAEAAARKGIEYNCKLCEAWNNLSIALLGQKHYGLAETAARKAIELEPISARGWINLSRTLLAQKDFSQSETAAQRACKLDPLSGDAWIQQGIALYRQMRHTETIVSFRQGLNLDPDAPYLLGNLLHIEMTVCNWDRFTQEVNSIEHKIRQKQKASLPFYVLTHTKGLGLQRKAAAIHAEDQWPERFEPGLLRKKSRHERVRIGYYSADYHNHATMYLMAELFELHDKARFELVGFSFGPDINDEMRQRVSDSFDQFIDVRGLTDKDVVRLSHDMGIDIAVDLKGYTEDRRTGIFAYRAAPIQVNYLGYPGTMATAYFDYIIADKTLIPVESQPHYSEKIVYLPHSYQVNDSKRRIANTLFSRQELGLPDAGFIYCCFNANHKITPDTFDGWMRILKQVDGSVLWLFEGNADATVNLRKEAVRRGVAPERLIFAKKLPLPEHLARIRLADLFLDTLPYNAHTTTSDALWAGLPVLTCTGEAFASRVAASLLNAIGLPELITTTQEEYESLAITLATQPEKLEALKRKLEMNRLTTPLFNAPLFTEHIENAYMQMYERYQSDLPPDHIYVQPLRGISLRAQ